MALTSLSPPPPLTASLAILTPPSSTALPGSLLIEELGLPLDKVSTLLDFAEKLVDCLHRAYPQAKSKLQKLLTALEKSSVRVEPSPREKRRCTSHQKRAS